MNLLLALAVTAFSFAPQQGPAPAPLLPGDIAIPSGANYDKAEFRAWLPPDVRTIKAVVVLVPGSNGDGRAQVDDEFWRAFAAKHQAALIGCRFTDKPHEQGFIEHYVNVSQGSGQALLDALGQFGARLNHPEMSTAPLLMWGMSAGGEFNYEFVAWKPERVAAFLVNKGGIYYTSLTPTKASRDVPGLLFVGEKDLDSRTFTVRGLFAVNRRAGALWGLVEEPGLAHVVGSSKELGAMLFEDVLTAPKGSINEKSGFVGDIRAFTYQPAATASTASTLTSWFPSERLARAWKSVSTAKPSADVLVSSIDLALQRPITDAGRKRAADTLAVLEAMGDDVLTQKTAGLSRMVSFNRGSKTPDISLLKRFLSSYDKLAPAERDPFRFGRYLAYEIMAEDAHRAGDSAREIALLREGVAKFTSDPGDKRELQITQQLLDRTSMIGRPAPAIVAGEWLNAKPGGGTMSMQGKLTLVEFTAHWCGPCRESYPALLAMQKAFGADKLRVVLATRYWGYFGSERNISPARELSADKQLYLDEDKLPFPIAIATPPAGAGPADGADVNAKAYFVQPIPHFVLIDAKGVVRAIELGWDADLERTLREKISKIIGR